MPVLSNYNDICYYCIEYMRSSSSSNMTFVSFFIRVLFVNKKTIFIGAERLSGVSCEPCLEEHGAAFDSSCLTK